MQALVLEEKDHLTLRNIEVDEPLGPHDVRIKLHTVGICGSDVHYYQWGRIGPFVVDFACTKHHLVIEADGGQHADSAADEERTAWLKRHGWRVLRFWNNDILASTEGVVETILRALGA